MEPENGTKTFGYSGTPLARKLGIKPGFRIMVVNSPDHYFDLFTDLPGDLIFEEHAGAKYDLIHFFTRNKTEYEELLPALKSQIKSNGTIWVSWPKKASLVITDVTETLVRNCAIQTGLVDIKVCAVDEIWSGLKLVIPVKDRSET